MKVSSWEGLPIELWYEIQLCALSHSLPLVCRRFYAIGKNASPLFQARYVLGRVLQDLVVPHFSGLFMRCLRYPICDQTVVQSICRLVKERRCKLVDTGLPVHLPHRLFRHLGSASSTSIASTTTWTADDEPLPFLRYLWECPDIPKLELNGAMLAKAIQAKFVPLVEFLLIREVSPNSCHRLALRLAIRQKDLELLKLLVEDNGGGGSSGSKGRDLKTDVQARRVGEKRADRVLLDAELMNLAIQVGAYDIVSYLFRERKVVPKSQTMKRLLE